jgi:CheY-like chemotaxis protein
MTKPAVLLLDDHTDSLTVLEAALRRRYAQDYLIVSEASAAAALRHLADLRDAGRPVALIMAAASMRTANSPDVLAEARSIQPAAKRVLVVPRGDPAAPSLRVPVPLVADRQAATPVLRAIAHGMIDAYLPAPGAGRDEGFRRGVSGQRCGG